MLLRDTVWGGKLCRTMCLSWARRFFDKKLLKSRGIRDKMFLYSVL